MLSLNFCQILSLKIFEINFLTQHRKREKLSQNNAKIKIRVDGMNIYGNIQKDDSITQRI